MAKTKELAKAKTNGDACPLAEARNMTWQFEGGDQTDKILPIAKIYQDKKQREKLGEHDEGDLVDSSTQELLVKNGDKRRFAPIFGYKEYIQWDQGEQGRILDRTTDASEIPAGGLEWTGDEDNRQPPAWTTHRNFMVIFEGCDMPVILSFDNKQKPRVKAAQLINTMMERRTKMGKGPAFFNFEVYETGNKKGEWFEPKVSFAGPCDEETAHLVMEWGQFAQVGNIKTNIDEAGVDATPSGDDAPF